MNGDFVGVMLDVNITELVAHQKISAGNPHVLRREWNDGIGCADGGREGDLVEKNPIAGGTFV